MDVVYNLPHGVHNQFTTIHKNANIVLFLEKQQVKAIFLADIFRFAAKLIPMLFLGFTISFLQFNIRYLL